MEIEWNAVIAWVAWVAIFALALWGWTRAGLQYEPLPVRLVASILLAVACLFVWGMIVIAVLP